MKLDNILYILETPEECTDFATKCEAVAQKARLKAIDLRVDKHVGETDLGKLLWKAIYAYEEVLTKKNKRRTPASRTRQMITRHGILKAAERAVNRKIEPMGYRTLAEMGLQDITFEAIIVKHPEAFPPDVVTLCRDRLEELKKLQY